MLVPGAGYNKKRRRTIHKVGVGDRMASMDDTPCRYGTSHSKCVGHRGRCDPARYDRFAHVITAAVHVRAATLHVFAAVEHVRGDAVHVSAAVMQHTHIDTRSDHTADSNPTAHTPGTHRTLALGPTYLERLGLVSKVPSLGTLEHAYINRHPRGANHVIACVQVDFARGRVEREQPDHVRVVVLRRTIVSTAPRIAPYTWPVPHIAYLHYSSTA
eukprot:1121887-Rhodomonas_salina.5